MMMRPPAAPCHGTAAAAFALTSWNCRHHAAGRTQVERRRNISMAVRENDRIVETATEARAGETGHNVRMVLGLSLFGVAVLFAVVYLYFFAA
jgi:hypothetical protein